ncbi:hypothetical protein CJF30_00010336 [Rutstroemia sp. NJR-2017a BBW]|nr:hypothetical protein CJF30_00010336 [Rutstroemia sp. NJR-2017a BBW]
MNGSSLGQNPARTVPIIQPPILQTSAPSPGDPMDVTPPSTAMMGPPSRTSPENEANGIHEHMAGGDQPSSGSLAGPSAAAAAAAGGSGPKVVQTAFIHKLYNMLEDQSIQHLISWSNSAESFVMSPSTDFSKVLSQYFKHTNISSFVRQLNMYGFHKVSDVFHTASPESPLWEFKHGLREIKRRASRHALVHRDSYSAPKPPLSQPGTPAEPIQSMQESTESRLTNLEHTIYDMHARLAKSDENSQFLHVRNQVVMDALARSLQLNQDMSRVILSLVPDPNAPAYRDVIALQTEIQRQTEVIRGMGSMEDPSEPPFSRNRSMWGFTPDNPPSPRQMPQDEGRRSSFLGVPPRQNFYRPPVPSHLSLPRRTYGSIGGAGTSQSSPGSLRSQPPPPPPPPHPLSSVTSPPANLSRRHTSADIRNVPGWQATSSPFASGQSSSQWPSSPKRTPTNEDDRIRESFSSYSLTAATQGRENISRPTTPPFSNGSTSDHLNTWSWGGRDKGLSSLFKDNSGPPTRRGSMAHILNPAETAEREEEHEEEMREEDRKRKRLQ